jgi:hypothetical protein
MGLAQNSVQTHQRLYTIWFRDLIDMPREKFLELQHANGHFQQVYDIRDQVLM